MASLRSAVSKAWLCTIIALSACITLSARPAAAQVVSLEALEKRVLETHVALAIHRAQARGARAEVRKARAAYYPTVSGTIDSSVAPGRKLLPYTTCKGPDNKTIVCPAGSPDSTTYQIQGAPTISEAGAAFTPQLRNALTIDAAAGIYDFGRTAAGVEARERAHDAALAEADRTRQDLVRGVRQAYVAWLSAYELHRLAAQAAEDAESQRDRIAALVQQSARPRTELAPAQAEALLAKLERERAQGDLNTARLTLEQAVGEPLPQNAEPDLALLSLEGQPTLNAQDAALRALHAQRAAASATARMWRRARLPRLAAAASAGLRQQQSSVFPVYVVGLSLSMPLWDGGLTSADAESASAQADELAARIDAQREQLSQEEQHARVDVANANERLSLGEQLLATSEEHLKEMEAAYNLNAVGLEQLNQARALVRRAQTEVLLAKTARTDALLRLAPTNASVSR